MKRKVVDLRRTARAKAATLIRRMANPNEVAGPEFIDLIAALPEIFESAVGYLLSEFDYDANQQTNTAIAIRLLATSAERFQRLQENA
jgi:hypothetical protein